MNLDKNYPHQYERLLQRLRQARHEADLTQEEVAALLGKPQYFVSRSESGARRIDAVELAAFARVYGKDVGYFLGE